MKDAGDVPLPSHDDRPIVALGPVSREDAEDDAQEALLRLLGGSGSPPDSPRAWLARVARNVAIDRWRRGSLERGKLALLMQEGECEDTPESELVRSEACRDAIRALLAGSDARTVAAVLLHEVFGLSYAEIARAGGRNEAAWRQAVRRALERARVRVGSAWRERADGEAVREADAVTLRFQRAVLMADAATLLQVLRVSAHGPAAPVGLVGSGLGNRKHVCTRFELDGRGARVSLLLGGVVLCTVSNGVGHGRTAAVVGSLR